MKKRKRQKKIESNKKVLTVCDNIESLAGDCRKQAERAAKYVEEFKNSYPVITDTRGERIKTKVEEFCSRIGLNKGFRSNSEKFEDMDRNLKALSEYLTAGGGPKLRKNSRRKLKMFILLLRSILRRREIRRWLSVLPDVSAGFLLQES